MLHSHPEIEISFKFIPKILMSKECIHFFGPLCSTYLLTPWCRVLLEKLTGLQLVKKFPAFLWNPKVHLKKKNHVFQRTIGQESLHQDSNDNGVRIVNFAT